MTCVLVGVQFIDVLVPTMVNGHDYGAAPMVSVVVGSQHMCALDMYGRIYTWGKTVECLYSGGSLVERRLTGALGHTNMFLSLVCAPKLLDLFQDALRVGCFKTLAPSHALAFCMGTIERLSKRRHQTGTSPVYDLPFCLLRQILQEIVLSPGLSSHADQGLKKLFGCFLKTQLGCCE